MRDSALTLAQQVGTAACSLLSTIIVARVLGPIGQGAYGVAFALAVLTMTLGNLGIGPATVFHVGAGHFPAALAARQNLVLAVGLGGLAASILLAVHRLWGQTLLPGVTGQLLGGAALLVPVCILNNYGLSVLLGGHHFAAYNRASFLGPVVTLACTLVGVAWLQGGTAAALGAQGAGQLAAAGYAWGAVPGAKSGSGMASWLPHRAYVRAVTHYGVRAYLGNALSYLNYRLDVFLLNAQLGASVVGIYSVAVGVGERLWVLSFAASTILLPTIASRQAGRDALTPVISRHVLWAVTGAAAGLGVLAPVLLPPLFGNHYVDAVPPLWALLPGLIACSVSRLLSNDIAGRGRPGLNAAVGAAALAINLGANLILIPRHGAVGAAAASSLAYGCDALAKVVLYCRLSGVPWNEVLLLQGEDAARLRRLLRRAP